MQLTLQPVYLERYKVHEVFALLNTTLVGSPYTLPGRGLNEWLGAYADRAASGQRQAKAQQHTLQIHA